MNYYYLFILITTPIALAGKGITGRSELNRDQETQIESLVIISQDEEKAVTNKAREPKADIAYYIGKLYDKVTPMTVNDQFVIPVLKHGIVDKEACYKSVSTKAT